MNLGCFSRSAIFVAVLAEPAMGAGQGDGIRGGRELDEVPVLMSKLCRHVTSASHDLMVRLSLSEKVLCDLCSDFFRFVFIVWYFVSGPVGMYAYVLALSRNFDRTKWQA